MPKIRIAAYIPKISPIIVDLRRLASAREISLLTNSSMVAQLVEHREFSAKVRGSIPREWEPALTRPVVRSHAKKCLHFFRSRPSTTRNPLLGGFIWLDIR